MEKLFEAWLFVNIANFVQHYYVNFHISIKGKNILTVSKIQCADRDSGYRKRSVHYHSNQRFNHGTMNCFNGKITIISAQCNNILVQLIKIQVAKNRPLIIADDPAKPLLYWHAIHVGV